jgi:hypothetical protein
MIFILLGAEIWHDVDYLYSALLFTYPLLLPQKLTGFCFGSHSGRDEFRCDKVGLPFFDFFDNLFLQMHVSIASLVFENLRNLGCVPNFPPM